MDNDYAEALGTTSGYAEMADDKRLVFLPNVYSGSVTVTPCFRKIGPGRTDFRSADDYFVFSRFYRIKPSFWLSAKTTALKSVLAAPFRSSCNWTKENPQPWNKPMSTKTTAPEY